MLTLKQGWLRLVKGKRQTPSWWVFLAERLVLTQWPDPEAFQSVVQEVDEKKGDADKLLSKKPAALIKLYDEKAFPTVKLIPAEEKDPCAPGFVIVVDPKTTFKFSTTTPAEASTWVTALAAAIPPAGPDAKAPRVRSLYPVASVDGVLAHVTQASVPVMDRGFLFGDSVYEVFRTYDGIPLAFAEHWARMQKSAGMISMKLTITEQELRRQIFNAVRATGAIAQKKDVYVRYCLTRGEGPYGLIPPEGLQNRLVVVAQPLITWKKEHLEQGIRLRISSIRRNPVTSLDPNIKSGNYLNNMLAVCDAVAKGGEECVMLVPEGDKMFVTECSNSNCYFVIGDKIATAARGVLAGITKAMLVKHCTAAGVPIEERDILASELAQATEGFITSATREVMPVLSLTLEDGTEIKFPPGGGPLTKRAAAVYQEFVKNYKVEHAKECIW